MTAAIVAFVAGALVVWMSLRSLRSTEAVSEALVAVRTTTEAAAGDADRATRQAEAAAARSAAVGAELVTTRRELVDRVAELGEKVAAVQGGLEGLRRRVVAAQGAQEQAWGRYHDQQVRAAERHHEQTLVVLRSCVEGVERATAAAQAAQAVAVQASQLLSPHIRHGGGTN